MTVEVADIMDLRMKNVQKLLKEVKYALLDNTFKESDKLCIYF